MLLQPVIDHIAKIRTPRGTWQLSVPELLKLLGADAVEYYRTLYTLKQKLHFTQALDYFTEQTAGELITVLEALGCGTAESAFSTAGLFLPHSRRIELTECLIRAVDAALSVHRIDYEIAAAILQHTGRLWSAYTLYLEEYLALPAVLEEAINLFIPPGGATPCLYHTAQRCLEDLFARKILAWHELFYPLYLRLENRFPLPEAEAGAEAANTPADPLLKARTLFGLGSHSLSRADLKQRYKELMKLYHPDLNPAGLEQAQAINMAYALLLGQQA